MLKNLMGISIPLLLLPFAVNAQIVRQLVTTNQGAIPVELAFGHGVNISFLKTEQVVEKVWLDNPDFVTLSSDGCLLGLQSAQNCSSPGAKVLHLRRINPLQLSGLPQTDTTSLTVLTRGKSEQKLYVFEITKVEKPGVLVIDIDTPRQRIAKVPVKTAIDHALITVLERGINRAIEGDLLLANSALKGRLEQFLELLAQGTTVTVAATQADISLPLVERLKLMGGYESRQQYISRVFKACFQENQDTEASPVQLRTRVQVCLEERGVAPEEVNQLSQKQQSPLEE